MGEIARGQKWIIEIQGRDGRQISREEFGDEVDAWRRYKALKAQDGFILKLMHVRTVSTSVTQVMAVTVYDGSEPLRVPR